ncbi:MAG: valine--tRNA ligase [Deltaproteobacteria bacterium]
MSTELAKAYEPQEVEERWARTWIDQKIFEADPEAEGEPFSIVIPPPNITGRLHLGHALNNTLQDLLIRFHKMDGANTLWIPGTDHASIATQNVVERKLAEDGLDRHAIGREAFLEKTFAWKGEVGPYIVAQLQRLGAACDWSRERFTMDEGLSRSVREVFVRLHQDGLIYRGRRLINWCCRCGTALSDIEVEHRDEKGSLWHLRYPASDGGPGIVVATTRPETMLGDTAVAVHPDDERYAALVGKMLVLPLVGREIPVIADDQVDREFGTGAVKITPAHDFSDFEMGQRHDLEAIAVIDEQGRMNEAAGRFKGQDRAECRAAVVEALGASGELVATEDHPHAVGTCYRCHEIVEPLLSTQWFVSVAELAEPAMQAVRDGRTTFHPAHWSKTYFAWLENIRDWCISRQLWWGHRIPAWYCDACPDNDPLVALEAPAACPDCGGSLRQDEDVLDTWFSSGLWPFSTMGWPDKTPEMAKYYPTSVLVTGFDILFFWVARMMMFGLRFTGEVPFRDVYVHGLVRDEFGAKMSKSKGNVRDPLELLAQYGTDALRFTLVSQTALGRDIRLSVDRIEGNRAFANKIWNAARFVHMNLEDFDPAHDAGEDDLAGKWIRARLSRVIEEVREAVRLYRFNDISTALYRFFWNEYCDWYLELAKPALMGDDVARRAATQRTLVEVLDAALRLLHPTMPFVTEELWRSLPRTEATPESMVFAAMPRAEDFVRDEAAEAAGERLIAVVRAIRSIRSELGVAPSRRIAASIGGAAASTAAVRELAAEIGNLARIDSLQWLAEGERPRGAAVAAAAGVEIFVPLAGLIDVEAERSRLEKTRGKLAKELGRIEKKLGNESFLARAPAEVVAKEHGKLEELRAEQGLLESALERLAEVDA